MSKVDAMFVSDDEVGGEFSPSLIQNTEYSRNFYVFLLFRLRGGILIGFGGRFDANGGYLRIASHRGTLWNWLPKKVFPSNLILFKVHSFQTDFTHTLSYIQGSGPHTLPQIGTRRGCWQGSGFLCRSCQTGRAEDETMASHHDETG